MFGIDLAHIGWPDAASLLAGSSWRLGASPPQPALHGRLRRRHRLVSRVNRHQRRPRRQLGLTLYGPPIKKAVPTASGVGVLAPLPATLGYGLAG